MADRIFLNDSAVIESDLTDDETGEPVDVTAVNYRFNDPNGVPLFVSTLPLTPYIGQTVALTAVVTPFTINDIVRWDGTQWNLLTQVDNALVEDNVSVFVFPAEMTNLPGLYQGRAQFTTTDGLTKSTKVWFEVVDPMETAATTIGGKIVDHTWMKIEDLFDSDLGGPWLRDETKRSFNKQKLHVLLADALYVVNNEYQPVTTFDETNWPEVHIPLASQALLVEAIYHFVRTYVEQPLPGGAPMGWFDRRDYLQRWQSVLTVEETKLWKMVDVFKLQYTGFGTTSILIGGHSSPITRYSKLWRTRMPRWVGPYGN